MAQTLTFQWSSGSLRNLHSKPIDKALAVAVTRAGSDALRKLKVESSRKIRALKRFKVSTVKKALPLYFPSGSKSLANLQWKMKVSGRPVALSEFPYRATKQGVKVQVNTGQWKLIKSAFVATLKNGHVGIFTRVGKERLPINQALTTRISDVFNNSQFVPIVYASAMAAFNKTFERNFPKVLKTAWK